MSQYVTHNTPISSENEEESVLFSHGEILYNVFFIFLRTCGAFCLFLSNILSNFINVFT